MRRGCAGGPSLGRSARLALRTPQPAACPAHPPTVLAHPTRLLPPPPPQHTSSGAAQHGGLPQRRARAAGAATAARRRGRGAAQPRDPPHARRGDRGGVRAAHNATRRATAAPHLAPWRAHHPSLALAPAPACRPSSPAQLQPAQGGRAILAAGAHPQGSGQPGAGPGARLCRAPQGGAAILPAGGRLRLRVRHDPGQAVHGLLLLHPAAVRRRARLPAFHRALPRGRPRLPVRAESAGPPARAAPAAGRPAAASAPRPHALTPPTPPTSAPRPATTTRSRAPRPARRRRRRPGCWRCSRGRAARPCEPTTLPTCGSRAATCATGGRGWRGSST